VLKNKSLIWLNIQTSPALFASQQQKANQQEQFVRELLFVIRVSLICCSKITTAKSNSRHALFAG